MQERGPVIEWSYGRTEAGMGSCPDLVYQTYTTVSVGVTEGSMYSDTEGACAGLKGKTPQ